MSKFHSPRTHIKGFTLVETLVAIVILSIGIAGAMTLVTSSTKNNNIAQSTTTAVYLANEAIEAIRAARDNDTIAIVCATFPLYTCPGVPTKWDSADISGSNSSLATTCTAANRCRVDVSTSPVTFYNSSASNAVVIGAGGFFEQGVVGTATQFTREFWVKPNTGHTEDIVTVEVKWTDSRHVDHTVDVTESIANVGSGNT